MLIYNTEAEVLAAVPHGLERLSQYCLYRVTDGIPIHPDGRPMDAHNDAFHSLASSLAPFIVASRGEWGLGFVIKADDPFFFIDLDGVLGADGQWLPIAHEVCGMFAGAAIEVSRSGTGIHIIGTGSASVPSNHSCKVKPHLECYTHGRYAGLTGTGKSGNAMFDCSAILPAFLERYHFGTQRHADMAIWHETAGPCAEWIGPQDDAMLIYSALSSNGSFATIYQEKCHFKHLWTGDAAVLSQYYPIAEGKPRKDGLPFDVSSAEMALCGHLAFWTGKDAPRIERLMEQSGLARDKWRNRTDYRRSTISKAIKNKPVVFDREHNKKQNVSFSVPSALDENIALIMSLDDMLAKLVYIGSTKEVIHTELGRARSWDAAVGEYAASTYELTDTESMKVKTLSALNTWRKHPKRKSFDVVTWAPGRPQACDPPEIKSGNSRAFNIWRGLHPYPAQPDYMDHVKPFLDHMEYLVPIETERKRFTQWLAHMVQKPGSLPHTAYVMIATTHGIGRNWLSSVLCRVLRGHVAASVDLEAIFESNYNGALSQKLLAIVDEAHEGMSDGKRYERGKTLRRIITEETRLINPKYGSQHFEYNSCRWLMFSNYEDALPIDNNDRRFEYIENPSEMRSEEYYSALYARLFDPAFIASVFQYLGGLDISDFKPGAHASWNEIKLRSLDTMTNELDRIVRELKEEWPGYWIPNGYVQKYLEDRLQPGTKIEPRHLQAVMKREGFRASGTYSKWDGRQQRVSILHHATPQTLKAATMNIVDAWCRHWVEWMGSDRKTPASMPY